jgi:sulfonate transport system ATP-binding protein
VIDSTDRVVLIEDGVIKREIDVPIERPRRRGSPQVAADRRP